MQLSGKRIFMVEDNLANKAIQTMLLEQKGARIGIERWGGSDTVRKLKKFMPVDVIVLDLMFPNEVTGYDVFSEIRTHDEFKHIPIVAVSASNPSEAIAKTRSYGFAGFISKPVDFDKFPEQIAEIINGNSIWATS